MQAETTPEKYLTTADRTAARVGSDALFGLLRKMLNRHFTMAADEYREGASDSSVRKHGEDFDAAEKEFCDALGNVVADSKRLDWLCAYITYHGLNGMERIAWTARDEDGKSLMHRETVSEDEVDDIRFDRAAIDAAMRGPNRKDQQ